MRMLTLRSCLLLLFLAIVGCGSPEQRAETIILATTTSTRDSGLLDVLVPKFEKETAIRVRVVAVGSGQALAMARRGDADVLLTHAPNAEKQFVSDGFGIRRRLVMHNDFVLVGPANDPAKVRGVASITEAFRRLAASGSTFVSRGDQSGTHLKEQGIWKQVGMNPEGGWYVEGGSGMAQTLRLANEKRACTLSDRGTFLSQKEKLELVILSQGDPLLKNQYSVIVVSPKKHPHVQVKAAQRFADFLISPETQKLIGTYGTEKYGGPLFFPNPGGPDAGLEDDGNGL